MAAPLSGIRVLEVANWLAAPAAGALLADLGAEVIKVEPPGGEVYREFLLRSMGYTHDFATNYAFHLDNRGKRSLTVALDRPGGPELVRRLCQRADVFLTNRSRPRCDRSGVLLVMPEDPALGRFETLDTPFKIYGADVGARGPAPSPGQHTFEVLAELGVEEDELARLAVDGVI